MSNLSNDKKPVLVKLADTGQLENFIEKALDDLKIPGMGIGIVQNGQTIYAKGFGVKELGEPDRIDNQTIFPIASLTKTFTAALAAKLIDQKKLSWDSKIEDYLPWFKLSESYVSREASITDFLCHQTGLNLQSSELMAKFGYSNREIFNN